LTKETIFLPLGCLQGGIQLRGAQSGARENERVKAGPEHTHSLSLSLALTHTLSHTHSHTHTLSLSLSLTHTHMCLRDLERRLFLQNGAVAVGVALPRDDAHNR